MSIESMVMGVGGSCSVCKKPLDENEVNVRLSDNTYAHRACVKEPFVLMGKPRSKEDEEWLANSMKEFMGKMD